MRKLNYIKLFEAFDSKVLSKTLGFISDKESFLGLIKRIVEPLDYPISKLSDDYFEYLGFNKALKKADIITDEPCEATSASEFPEYGIEGESCKGGLLKRKWGRTIRSVVCPVCNGTGVKPKKPGDIKMLKFWFNKDGKFIATTGVDGIIRNELGGDDHGNGKLLKLRGKDDLNLYINPYTWNVGIDISYRGYSVNPRKNIEESIKDANFAIILDLSKLKKSEYVKRTKIRQDRVEFKKGSTALLSDEEIKKQNIARYLDKISTKIDIIDDISNLPKLVKRIIGYRYALFLLKGSSNVENNLSNIISLYYDVISSSTKDYSIKKLNDYIESSLRRGMEFMNRCSSNLSELYKMIKDEKYEKERELLKFLIEISEILYKKVSEMDMETIEDLEVLHHKLNSIRIIFTSSSYVMNKCSNFIESLIDHENAGRSFNYLTDSWRIQDNIDGILSERERVKKIISKI